jgi:hypothetical protein
MAIAKDALSKQLPRQTIPDNVWAMKTCEYPVSRFCDVMAENELCVEQ